MKKVLLKTCGLLFCLIFVFLMGTFIYSENVKMTNASENESFNVITKNVEELIPKVYFFDGNDLVFSKKCVVSNDRYLIVLDYQPDIKVDKIFSGWEDKISGKIYYNGTILSINNDIKLYANYLGFEIENASASSIESKN